jgi:hypothetical protein
MSAVSSFVAVSSQGWGETSLGRDEETDSLFDDLLALIEPIQTRSVERHLRPSGPNLTREVTCSIARAASPDAEIHPRGAGQHCLAELDETIHVLLCAGRVDLRRVRIDTPRDHVHFPAPERHRPRRSHVLPMHQRARGQQRQRLILAETTLRLLFG